MARRRRDEHAARTGRGRAPGGGAPADEADASPAWADEARLRSIVDHLTDALVVVDAQGSVLWASPAIASVLGLPPAAVGGTHLTDYVHPEDLPAATESIGNLLRGTVTGTPVRLRARRADGSWAWVEAAARPVEPGSGLPGPILSLRDVTARVDAEEAARRSELRLRTVVENSYDVVAVLDRDTTIRWVTPNCSRLLGWSVDEVIGTAGLDLVHPGDVTAMIEELDSFNAGVGVPTPTTIRLRHRDGGYRFVEVVATDFLDNPEVAGLALSLRGVEDRMAVEAERQRLADIFELSGDLVVTARPDGEVVYANSAARQLLGLAPGDALGEVTLVDWVGDLQMRRLGREIRPALAAGDVWSGEVEVVAGGRPVPALAKVMAHREPQAGIEFVSVVARDISNRKALELRLVHEATHDPLTSLPNRTMLIDRLTGALARSQRQGGAVAVLFCDLDDFKVVNDSLGHSAGDALLSLVAERLREQLRPQDTVARFGGDEFVVLCEDLDGPADAVAVAKRIDHGFASPFRLHGSELFVGVSIGIALSGDGMAAPEDLVREADAAMYGAKAGGRGRYQLFEPGMWQQALGRLDLGNALRAALARDEFHLVFQPVYAVGDRRAVGVEALVRWRHPERGELAPEEFLEVAAEVGLGVPLGRWVLRRACEEFVLLAPPDADLWVSVNVSAVELLHPDFVDAVAQVLGETGMEPGRLWLELTERVLMQDAARSGAVLARLRQLGVRIAVDDFGTGYSSVGWLRRLPVEMLKIDGSFVGDLGRSGDGGPVVAALVALARTLGLVTVAEGVETETQRRELAALGCQLFQGALGTMPVAAPDLAGVLVGTDHTG